MVTNVSAIKGLVPVQKDLSTEEYYIPATDGTAVFIGDLVKLEGSADHKTGRPTVIQAAAGSSTPIHVGVVVGVNQVKGISVANTNHARLHRPASLGMYVTVCDDPRAVYEVQCDGVGLAPDAVGSNGDIVVGSGSTVNGRSAMVLGSSTVTTTGTFPLKVIGFVDRPDVAIGTTSTVALYAKALVKINTHWLLGDVQTALAV